MKKLILVLLTLSVMLFGKENEILLLLEGKIELNSKTCNELTYQNVAELTKEIGEKASKSKLKELCNLGCGEACSRGTSGKLKYSMREELKKGCDAKFPHGYACSELSYDKSYANDENKKIELRKKACEVGFTSACYSLANNFAIDKNYGLALKYYNTGCDLGDDQACGELGMIYARGDYGEKSDKKAFEYWSKSVNLNPKNTQSKDNLKILCRFNSMPECRDFNN